MVVIERSKRRSRLRKAAITQFIICFIVGFAFGFKSLGNNYFVSSSRSMSNRGNTTRLLAQESIESYEFDQLEVEAPRKLLIVVTTIQSNNPLRRLYLRRLSNTLRLVHPPLLWIVVDLEEDVILSAPTLRSSGVLYRHLVIKKKFKDPKAEIEHQRNIALSHIKKHKFSGIVHFSDLHYVYDLQFFNEIREIEKFGTWKNQMKLKKKGSIKCLANIPLDKLPNNLSIRITEFAFDNTILWDPKRWGLNHTEDSTKFLEKMVAQEKTKLMFFPSKCSQLLIWQLPLVSPGSLDHQMTSFNSN